MSSKKKFLFLLMFFIIGQTVFAGIDHRIAKIIVNEHQHRPIEGTISSYRKTEHLDDS